MDALCLSDDVPPQPPDPLRIRSFEGPRDGWGVGLLVLRARVYARATRLPLGRAMSRPKRPSDGAGQGQVECCQLLEHIGSAVLGWTPDGILTYLNAQAEALFGWRREEALGRHLRLLVPQIESIWRDPSPLFRGAAADPDPHRQSVSECLCRDGRRIWMLWTHQAVPGGNGRAVRIVSVGSDIGDLKQAESALREERRRRDERLRTLVHDLRNALAPLSARGELLARGGEIDAGDRPDREPIGGPLEHTLRLVDELSRLAHGLSDPSDPSRSARKATAHVPEPLTVERLVQLTASLLGEAATVAGESHRMWLRVRCEGNRAIVSIREREDAGPGMLPAVLESLAEGRGGPPERLGASLSLVHNLVETYGGTLEIRGPSAGPDSGEGSELNLYLPLAEDIQPHPSALAQAPSLPPHAVPHLPPVAAETPEGPDPAGHRTLVVDDNIDAADALGMLLAALGTEVRVLYDGASALDCLRSYAPDIVFLDIGMPGMDGCEVARRMREQVGQGSLVLVAVTGLDGDEDRERVQSAGFDLHVVKPVSAKSIQAALAISRSSVSQG